MSSNTYITTRNVNIQISLFVNRIVPKNITVTVSFCYFSFFRVFKTGKMPCAWEDGKGLLVYSLKTAFSTIISKHILFLLQY